MAGLVPAIAVLVWLKLDAGGWLGTMKRDVDG